MSILRSPIRAHFPVLVKNREGFDMIKEFDDLLNFGFSKSSQSLLFPKVQIQLNAQESKEGYHFEIEIPGVKREDLEISVKDEYLVLKGEKKSFDEEKKDQYHYVERSHGKFLRSILLPNDADKDHIQASLNDGVLKIDIMKSKVLDSSEKKIQIQ